MTITLSRRVLAILGVVAVFAIGIAVGLIVSAGGDKVTTVTTVANNEEDESTPENVNRASESSSAEGDDEELPSCEEAGIDVAPRHEGTCNAEGQKAVVVNEESTLELKELKVDLLGVETTKSASSKYGETRSASGTYAIFTLEVTNKTNVSV